MSIKLWGQTDIGLRRKENQDAIFMDEDLGVFAVADGMGGHSGGSIAAQMTLDTVSTFIRDNKPILDAGEAYPVDLLAEACQEATRVVYEHGHEKDLQLMGMGTTLVLGFFYEFQIYIVNVGDSRAYYWNNENLWQISEDHSLIYQKLKEIDRVGEEEDKETIYTPSNVITRCVGFEDVVKPSLYVKEAVEGDLIFLCSDGFHGGVTDKKLKEVLETTTDPEIPTCCINEAKKTGGDDNISVIIARF